MCPGQDICCRTHQWPVGYAAEICPTRVRNLAQRAYARESVGAACDHGGMAYDEALADKVRKLIADEPGRTEKRMFGGLAMLLNGNMAVSVRGKGGLMIRVDP